jgi:hypothetical protein
VCFAKSLAWPGAVAVAAGFHAPVSAAEQPRRRVTNVYVGFGVPRQVSTAAGRATHTPRPPAPLPAEASLPPDEQADVVVEPPKPAEEEE